MQPLAVMGLPPHGNEQPEAVDVGTRRLARRGLARHRPSQGQHLLNDELHALLSGLPRFPYMSIKVTPLARHPSAI